MTIFGRDRNIKGGCVQCGDCCFYGDAITYDVYEKTGGIFLYCFNRVNAETAKMRHPCEHLTFGVVTKKAVCNIYATRPEVCRQYPYKKEELIFKNCGYKEEK